MTSNDNTNMGNGRFEAEFCGKACRAAAVACLMFLLCAAVGLAGFTSASCPGGMIQPRGGAYPVWPFVVMAGLSTAVVCFGAIRWERVARRIIEQIEWGERTPPTGRNTFAAMYTALLDTNRSWVLVMVGFAAMPVLIIAQGCR